MIFSLLFLVGYGIYSYRAFINHDLFDLIIAFIHLCMAKWMYFDMPKNKKDDDKE